MPTSLHSPKAARRCCAEPTFVSVCFKCFIGILQCFISMFENYVGMLHMLQWCSSVCSKYFICFLTYVVSTLFGCCKNKSGCYIYMHVASIYFSCFVRMFQMFYLDVAYVFQ
jgi:hypothetical protein